ncbi:hypothetical protein EXIGLDRAFT_845467 [Exidia glandulosa HHB12029]|uniref:DNA repair and recombination protein RAD54B n=1 Tax=Exidia glandulosa HHB12029 TaxID=1314781 RepID=A0A165BF71_EXIGL|nr:hypothetical protein EXIGLDRAFT_845467 [Exidia glandulosa HHB12029]
MPAFANPAAGFASKKRKSEGGHDEQPSKRNANDGAWSGSVGGHRSYWMCQYRAPQYRKHKTWDGDGVLEVLGTRAILYDMDSKKLSEGTVKEPKTLADGVPLTLGGKELELECAIPVADFLSGKCFGKGGDIAAVLPVPPIASSASKGYVPLKLSVSTPTPASAKKYIDLEPVNMLSKFNTPRASSSSVPATSDSYWSVTWRKAEQTKKNKTWEGDAFISHVGTTVSLISDKGKVLGTRTWKDQLTSGHILHISGKEVQLSALVKKSEMPSLFGGGNSQDADDAATESQANTSASAAKAFVAPASFYSSRSIRPTGPLHDPTAEGAIVMKAPSQDHQAVHNKKEHAVVPVVIDPYLARHLRPHQVEGVKFMYECVMGMRPHEGFGCILADDMGMGKTLQTITLVWTLIKQNPYSSTTPAVGKVLVVCPVTLINNWRKEFQKWLGRDRIGVFVGDKDKANIKQFINSRANVLIIGYEKLRSVIADLAYCTPPIGLIICDEGHRLKSANNKSNKMFEALRTKRRVILSGTPIQNDLGEFHAMADFCNPGLLDDYSTFKRIYETPILKSRAPECSKKELEEGEARSQRLFTIAKSFVIRRDASILTNYLPPKYEYTVFVTPTELQLRMFKKLVVERHINRVTHGHTANALAMIRTLTKLSTSPMLLKRKDDAGADDPVTEAIALIPEKTAIDDMTISGKLSVVSRILSHLRKETEEKVIIVSHYTSTLDVIEKYCKNQRYGRVSTTFQATSLLTLHRYFRLDGQTQPAKRQEYVDTFNRTPQKQHFVFLLSTKAGGVGLNLVGASRLVLVDSDWNPSHDLQAMARIHRDGQKRPVFIYRLLSAGTIDEKIFQRQVTKLGLSDSLMRQNQIGGAASKSDSFSPQDLRDLFSVHVSTSCHTHDLLACPCDSENGPLGDDDDVDVGLDGSDGDDEERGFVVASTLKPTKNAKPSVKRRKELASLDEWTHINCLRQSSAIHDDVLKKIVEDARPQIKPDDSASQLTRKERLLIDLDNCLNNDEDSEEDKFSSRPPGTLTFLFEKTSL